MYLKISTDLTGVVGRATNPRLNVTSSLSLMVELAAGTSTAPASTLFFSFGKTVLGLINR